MPFGNLLSISSIKLQAHRTPNWKLEEIPFRIICTNSVFMTFRFRTLVDVLASWIIHNKKPYDRTAIASTFSLTIIRNFITLLTRKAWNSFEKASKRMLYSAVISQLFQDSPDAIHSALWIWWECTTVDWRITICIEFAMFFFTTTRHTVTSVTLVAFAHKTTLKKLSAQVFWKAWTLF